MDTRRENDAIEVVVIDEHGSELRFDSNGDIDLRDHDPIIATVPVGARRKGLDRFFGRRKSPHAPVAVHVCGRCGRPATTDLEDAAHGRLYLSCSACAHMWQVKVAPSIVRDPKEWMVRD
jgi:DNA-directed RNA polymerase subunit RPC12/RpoP